MVPTTVPGYRRRIGIRAASAELARRDPVLARLVAQHRPMHLGPRTPVAGRFEAIARSIVYQQLAGRAAAAIWGRTCAVVTGQSVGNGVPARPFDPDALLALDDGTLRSAGLSAAKVAALRDLAVKVSDGAVRLGSMGRRGDDEVIAELSQVRGVGEWTAHMFLLFHLRRLDVWPTGDLGVRNGYRLAWGLAELPGPRQLAEVGEDFRPYRSVVAWYCWRAVDGFVTPEDRAGEGEGPRRQAPGGR